MSTPLSTTEPLPASPADVFALLTDSSFLVSRMDAGGGIDPSVISLVRDGDDGYDGPAGGAMIVTQQSIPAAVLPSMAQSMIPGDPVTQRTETWSPNGEGYTAELAMTVKGAPASLKGTITLALEGASGSGSTFAVDAEASVPIPMFGPKLEGVIVDEFSAILAKEADYTRSKLG